ncbi:MAG: mechanosensitive ion channel family protein [Patescibacteria group bacterium]
MESLQSFIEQHAYQWAFEGLLATGIVLAFWLLYHLTKRPLSKFLFQNGFDSYLVDIAINNFYKSILIIIAIITALGQIGINVLAAMTGFGIAGIAIGFAAKDTLGNIIAGITILWDKPFVVGDWIKVDGEFGQVQFITLRTTRIHTRDNHHIIIPNERIINSTVTNHHHARPVRCRARIYLPYGSDIDEAKRVIIEALENIESVQKNPKPSVGVAETKNGLIPLVVFAWAPNARKSIGLTSKMRRVCITALIENGFTAPYPVVLAENAQLTKKIKKKK